MSRVITFSRKYPAKHPRAGEPTHFVEKIWISLFDAGLISMSKAVELSRSTGIGGLDIYKFRRLDLQPKGHSIRAGNRWKVGDKFSPRVWSGKPYASKMITIAPDIEIKKIWNVKVFNGVVSIDVGVCWDHFYELTKERVETLAKNDGLAYQDFLDWFSIHTKAKKEGFSGQVLCWSENINY